MESIINTNSVTFNQGLKEWAGPEITVICSDGQVTVKKDKLMATGQYFRDCMEDSSETLLDLSVLPPVKITKGLFERALEFT